MGGREQADITGLIGQYAHGNEPSHHMAYLYNFIGQAWKTQEYVRQILTEMYDNTPNGLCGNEDCGQMSAWYVFSSMGFYPVTPGSNQYVIGAPLFDKITIHLENENDFQITADNNSEDNMYVQSVTLNEKELNRSFITHEEIISGGILHFEMGSEPNKEYGAKEEDRPVSQITEYEIIPSPFVVNAKRGFTKEQKIELGVIEQGLDILYTLDGTDPREEGLLYEDAFLISGNVELKICSRKNDSIFSPVFSTLFFELDPNRDISLETEYSEMYSASGNKALIDGITGGNDFRTGDWQGFYGEDVVAVVDLGSVKQVLNASIRFLQQQESWILMPKEVQFYISTDNKNFRLVATLSHDVDPKTKGAIVHDFTTNINQSCRYIKVVAKNFGTCPDWHLGGGNPSWLFTDEIKIY
jgi:hypothetical protein